MNISNVFENLSASVSNIIDHRHEYIEKSKRKLTGLTSSTSAFRKAKTTYINWMKTYAHTRISITKKYSWQQILHYGHYRKRPYSSKIFYPIQKIRSIKNWLKNLF